MRPQWARSTSITDLIPNRIVTMGHDSTLNSDPSTYLLPVELRLNKVSKFNGAIKIQQLGRVIIQRKIHWIVTPGRYSMGGSKFYLTPAQSKIEKVPRGIQGEKSRKDMASSKNLVSTIGEKWQTKSSFI